MSRAFSLTQLYNEKYELFDFKGKWKDFVGCPERKSVWFIMAQVGSGKTTFIAMLCNYLSEFGTVAYNSIEEGKSESLRQAFLRANVDAKKRRIIGLNKETCEDLRKRLSKHKSPRIVILDTIQHSDIRKADYLSLKKDFPDVTWIVVSHMDGNSPEGRLAKFIHQDAGVKIKIEGYVAFPKSRFGGNQPMTIWEEGAKNYFGSEFIEKQ